MKTLSPWFRTARLLGAIRRRLSSLEASRIGRSGGSGRLRGTHGRLTGPSRSVCRASDER